MIDNILLYLLPKSKVEYLEEDDTLRQVMEKMDYHHYTAIPILTKDGKYFGTMTEGDILRYIKKTNFKGLTDTEKVPLKALKRDHDCMPIKSTATIKSLLNIAIDQNFVPVIDDEDNFIGIVTRKQIILHALRDLTSEDSTKK